MTKREQAHLTRARIRFLFQFQAGATMAQLARKWGRAVVEKAIREGLKK